MPQLQNKSSYKSIVANVSSAQSRGNDCSSNEGRKDFGLGVEESLKEEVGYDQSFDMTQIGSCRDPPQ